LIAASCALLGCLGVAAFGAGATAGFAAGADSAFEPAAAGAASDLGAASVFGAAGAASAFGAAGGAIARTAVWHPGERLDMFFCKHSNASVPPGVTLEQCAMKSERHADRTALFSASVGACANALVALAKSAAASNALRAATCFNVLNI
jgi:hypothetical protein